MKEQAPKVAVIILNWNGLEDTRECLNSFKKVTYPNFGVVLIDNGSAVDESKILAEEFKECFSFFYGIRLKENLGFCGGNNFGIRYAQRYIDPKYYLLINNDTIVHPDFLQNLVQALEENQFAGMASPKIFCYPEKEKLWWPGVHKVEIGWKIHIRTWDTNVVEETDIVTGCCMLIKSDVIQKVGFLRSDFFLSRFDTFEYSLRAKKANFKLLYVPSAVIWHKYSAAAVRMNLAKRLKEALVGDVIFSLLVTPKTRYLPFLISYRILNFLADRMLDVINVLTKPEKRKKFYVMVRSDLR